MPDTPTRRARGRPKRHLAPDREEILQSALRAFARDGFDGTNLRRIAADAAVDVALVSRHFGPKLDLWKAVVDELARRMATARLEIMTPEPADKPSAARIADALRRFVAFNRALPELGKFFVDEISRAGPRRDYVIDRLWRPHRDTMLPLLVDGGEAGLVPGSDAEMLLLMLIGAVAMPLLMLPLIDAADVEGEKRLTEAVVATFVRA
ncbi:MAG TPA: TetR/AcrR family transcriptional regulator [Allosphingosinicella sp.]